MIKMLEIFFRYLNRVSHNWHKVEELEIDLTEILSLPGGNHSARRSYLDSFWSFSWQRGLPSWCWSQERGKTGQWSQVWVLPNKWHHLLASNPSWGCSVNTPEMLKFRSNIYKFCFCLDNQNIYKFCLS